MPGGSPRSGGSCTVVVSVAALILAAAPQALPVEAQSATVEAAQPGTPAAGDPCGAEILLAAQFTRDPDLARRREAVEALVREAQRTGLIPQPATEPNASSSVPIYTIPTVVHVIHTGQNSPENISDAQILSQIAAINRDLQNTLNYPSPANDSKIQLCLASKDPSGSSTSWPGIAGVTRHFDATATVAMDVPASDAAIKAYGYFPSNRYLNVWVVKRITLGGAGSVIGYATFPGTVPAAVDGIVMDHRVMGANNTGYGTFASLLPNYEEGKVFAHEVGHYLDLFHTFHNGCSPGDLVADTPPEAVNFWGCPQGSPTTACNVPAPIHNFMDYTNDVCRWEFTAGQQTRMFAAISAWRSELVSAANLISTGACPPNVFAHITASPSQQCKNVPISFSAPPCGGACTYTWTFQGGIGGTSGQNTSATFATPGPHQVTLTISDGATSSNASTTVYISDCAPINGPCANWVFGNGARLDFASGMPVAVAGSQNAGPECATQISSNSGTLLFYTDNHTIWNANHLPMTNSSGFVGGKSSHTGALIVPRPLTPNHYYLLSVKEWEKYPNTAPSPLTITTIDMTQSGGLGAVTALNVPIALPVGVSSSPLGLVEGVTAVPHCNGNDWWVVTCGADSTNSARDWERFLYVTPVTAAGAAATSQQYPIGFTGAGSGFSAWGTVVSSRDGTRLAVCQSMAKEVRIYDFNRATGVPTLALATGDILANHDVEFSPDGKLIYFTYVVGTVDIFANGLYGVRQMDLATQQIRTVRAPTGITKPLDVQLGPDDKIYVARSGQIALDVINYPNQFNTNNLNECGYNPSGVPLGTGVAVNSNGALPNTIGMCSASVPPASFTYSITNCTTVTFRTPNCGPWTWNFGDGSPLASATGTTIGHTYANPGSYTVTLTAPSAAPPVASQSITLGAAPISISGSTSSCGGPHNYSVVGPSSYTYVWTITGGTPATATGNNVFVSWSTTAGAIQVVGTDPRTGCTSLAAFGLEACSICTPPPKDLVAWWPLDETAGASAQEIVAARNGVDVNAPVKAPGAVGNARVFNAATSHVRVNHDPGLDLGTGNLTLDAWVRTASAAPYQGIVEKRSLAPDRGYALYLKQGQLALWLGDGTTGTEFVAGNSNSLADGQWHHVAATEDRGDAATGTVLYVDGAPVAVLPGFAGAFGLDNPGHLLIGAQAPASSPVWVFDGGIDEVEIFNRALAAPEIEAMWASGPAGKCKELVVVPGSTTVCSAQPHVLVTFWVCNYGTQSQTYSVSFAGATGPGCTIAGPTSFTILSQHTNGVIPTVGPGSCQSVTVKIDKPNGMVNGDVSCYTVTATNTATNVARVTRATLWANESLCPILTSSGLSAVGVGVAVSHTWGITNRSGIPLTVGVQVDARSAAPGPVGADGAVRLNGLPPGTPWISTYALAPGESASVSVNAEFASPAPFEPYDVVLGADVDGDGVPDAEIAAAMLNTGTPLAVIAVPRTGLPTRPRLLQASPNPFRRALAVEFELSRESAVRLELFDVNGRRVREVVEEAVPAGRSLRMMDARGLRSGVYLLRLEAGGGSFTRRVVLLRE